MAAATKPTSLWVSSYADKTQEWVLARLEHFERLERMSRTGSSTRRSEIRKLRVELLNRKKAVGASAEGSTAPALPPTLNGSANGKANAPAPVSGPPTVQRGVFSPAAR